MPSSRLTSAPLALLALMVMLIAGCQTPPPPGPAVSELHRALLSPSDQLLSVEEDALPHHITAGGGSEAAITTFRTIDGSRSLVWRWQRQGAALTIRQPIAYEPEPPPLSAQPASSVFSFWIYNETALAAPLRIEFGRGNNVDCWFDFNLNFVGWRTAWIDFDHDLQGRPHPRMDMLRFRAPAVDNVHRLFLDRISLATRVDQRYRQADYQVPFVAAGEATYPGAPRVDLMALSPKTDGVSITPGVISSLDTIADRLDAAWLDDATIPPLAELRRHYRNLRIRYEDGVIRGLHIPASVHHVIHPDDVQDAFHRYVDTAGIQAVSNLMLDLARAYRTTAYPRQQDEVREMFLAICRHLLDQGWAEGSGLGSLHHGDHLLRAWYPATYLMREPLRDAELLVPMSRAAQWFSSSRQVLLPAASQDADLDSWSTRAGTRLLALMSMPDSREKIALLQRYSDFLSESLAMRTPGNLGGIKPDGTTFYQGGFSPAYTVGALNQLGSLFGILSGTTFRLSAPAYENVKRALLTTRLYGNPDWSLAISGRHPFTGSTAHLRTAYRELARAGHPSQPGMIDQELTAAYLRLWPSSAREQQALFGLGAPPPEVTPHGAWALNYAALGLTWMNRHLVTIKGHNRYAWNTAISASDNRYGRYQSYGSVLIMSPGGHAASGFVQNGWNWNSLPGTTTIHLPLDLLQSHSPTPERLLSNETFAGAAHLDNRYGAFAVSLNQPRRQHVDPSFQARKSVFSFDTFLVALGTGITNESSDYPTETTLFQSYLHQPDAPLLLDGESYRAIPTHERPDPDAPHWLVDPAGNGYVVPAGQQLQVVRQHQQSRHHQSGDLTAGTFAVAWLDHGAAPRDASYQYMILPGAGRATTATFAAAPPVEIIYQNNAVHAVHDTRSGVISAAFFEPGQAAPRIGLLSVSRPCLIIREQTRQGLRMSVTDPDLNIPPGDGYLLTGEARPTSIHLVLEGTWRLQERSPRVTLLPADGVTRIEITSHHGFSTPFTLRRLN